MKDEKVNIWIFRGGSCGLSVRLSRGQLTAFGIGTFTVLMFLGYFTGNGLRRLSEIERRKVTVISDAEATVRSEVSANPALISADEIARAGGTPNSAPNGTDSSPTLSAPNKNVETQLQLLAKEFSRIRTYEDQLRKRASFLDAILDDAKKLDYDFSEAEESPSSKGHVTKQALGVGGGDAPVSRLLHFDSNKAGPVSKRVPLLLNELDHKIAQISSLPLGAPVQGKISSGFGYRVSPFTGSPHIHTGIDFSVDRQSSVVATADGLVVNAGVKGAYGNAVIIKHGKDLETLYGHLSKVLVKAGDRVCRGEQIGLVGTTGRSTGPHVHYEIRVDGEPRDPAKLVDAASFLKLLHG